MQAYPTWVWGERKKEREGKEGREEGEKGRKGEGGRKGRYGDSYTELEASNTTKNQENNAKTGALRVEMKFMHLYGCR